MLLDDFIDDLEQLETETELESPRTLKDILRQHPCITPYDLTLIDMMAAEQSLALQPFLASTGILPEPAFLKIKLVLQGLLPLATVDMYGLFNLTALRQTMTSSQLQYLGYPPIQYQLDRYFLEKELGNGASSRVFLASHNTLKRKVALKVLSPLLASRSESTVQQFLTEGQISAQLCHPAFVQIFEAQRCEDYVYLALEYVPGSTLEEVMLSQSFLPVYNILVLAGQITQALEYLHDQGFVHRDLKPENIVCTPQGRIKILDLGIAAQAKKGSQESQIVKGSPYYLSPEHLSHCTDARSDIYSLGVILYALSTGRLPFQGDSLQDILRQHTEFMPQAPILQRSDLPQSLSDLIMAMLAKNPAERPQGCAGLLEKFGLITARETLHGCRSPVALMREFLGV